MPEFKSINQPKSTNTQPTTALFNIYIHLKKINIFSVNKKIKILTKSGGGSISEYKQYRDWLTMQRHDLDCTFLSIGSLSGPSSVYTNN